MKNKKFDYEFEEELEEIKASENSLLYRFLRWLLAIAITVGVLIAFNS